MPALAALSKDSPLHRELSDVPGISPVIVKQLGKEEITSVADLVAMLPFRHEDRRRMEGQTFQADDVGACHHVIVVKTAQKFFGNGRGAGSFEAVVQHAANPIGQQMTLIWWRMPFMAKVIAEGHELIVHGKIKDFKGKLSMAHPEYEIIRGGEDDEQITIHAGRITPIYRLRGGLQQKSVRQAAYQAWQSLGEHFIEDLLPKPRDDGEFAGWHRSRALREAHFPTSPESLEQARRYLALEEFYLYQLRVVRRRRDMRQSGGRALVGDGALVQRFIEGLPFALTDAQSRCIDEVRKDLAATHPMNRLLHGDVGSGKTVVAFASMLTAIEAGTQAAMMAPTQILAEQLARNARKWFEPMGLRVALLTGSTKDDGSGVELLLNASAANSMGSTRVARVGSGVAPEPSALKDATRYSRRNLPHFERPWAKYVVTFTTFARRVLTPAARDAVMESVKHFAGERYRLMAAVVMPDHVHIVIEPRPKDRTAEDEPIFWTLSELMHSLKSYTAKEINRIEDTKGAKVWVKESFDRMIRSQTDLEEKVCYLLDNPRRAKLVAMEEKYPWSWCEGESVRRDAEHDTRDACAPQESHAAASPLPNTDKPNVVIGTHALLHDDSLVHDLGMIVIDEQHKFGVAQRAKLIQQGTTPHVLVMTATPIPRTLTLTIYGDLDVSTIDQRPQLGVTIVTKVRPRSKIEEAAKFLREQLAEGRQGYLVYPLIEESEKSDASAATKGHKEWTKLLEGYRVGLLHGRMNAEEKEAVMRPFREGELHALVSTTVIEVGVDVPNATVMFIHDAGRFGLAQLHQLRGRIGRGTHHSFCVLFVDDKDEEAKERLAVMEETSDGFKIAEEDLRRRGPGNVLGLAQSGQSPLRFAELLADTRLVRTARVLAERTLESDPLLEKHPSLKPFAFEGNDPPKEMMQ